MIDTIRADLTEVLAEINESRGLPANYGLEDFLRKSLESLMARPAIREKLLMSRSGPDDAGQRLTA
jgi:hypothetical protein